MIRIPLHWPVAFIVSKVAGIPIDRASRIVTITAMALIVFGVLSLFAKAHSQDWKSSPMNWENSEMNWDNSPMNWKNSPMNYKNSQMNTSSSNGIYNSDGGANWVHY